LVSPWTVGAGLLPDLCSSDVLPLRTLSDGAGGLLPGVPLECCWDTEIVTFEAPAQLVMLVTYLGEFALIWTALSSPGNVQAPTCHNTGHIDRSVFCPCQTSAGRGARLPRVKEPCGFAQAQGATPRTI
jgi:hypothetical protein